MDDKNNFLPPKSSRIYLHQPYSERMVVLFPEFKIVNMELNEEKYHVEQEGSGLILLHGSNMEAIDFRKIEYSTVKGGIPIYKVKTEEECTISMETFCNFERNPITFARITLKNNFNYTVSNSIGILPRSSKNDRYLTNLDTTGYNTYLPNVKIWYMVTSDWKNYGDNKAADGKAILKLKTDLKAEWIDKNISKVDHKASDYYKIDYTLGGGESVTIDLCFGINKGESLIYDDFDFDKEKEVVKNKWNGILSDIKVFPDTKIPKVNEIYLHLVTQCLQMFAKYDDSDLITTRQGDVGRFVWPWEAAHMLIALDRIGLHKYSTDAYKYFIEKWFTHDGSDKGKVKSIHQQWGNLNGSLIWGISEHLMYTKNRTDFEFFRPYLNDCLSWMESERKKSYDDPKSKYKNIFPVGKGTDWGDQAQHWCFTDGQNVRGVNSMAKMYKMFGAEEYDYVQSCYEDYQATMESIIDELYAGHENDESFHFPHQLGIDFKDTLRYCYYICGAIYLFYSGVIPYNSRMFEQMENYFNEHGMFEKGLAGRMTNADDRNFGLYGDVFYTTQGEIIWLQAWKQRNETNTKKYHEMMEAVLKYCITSEYIVSERYCSTDPWYSPWQPNASGSGRIINIILNYYGEKTTDN